MATLEFLSIISRGLDIKLIIIFITRSIRRCKDGTHSLKVLYNNSVSRFFEYVTEFDLKTQQTTGVLSKGQESRSPLSFIQ